MNEDLTEEDYRELMVYLTTSLISRVADNKIASPEHALYAMLHTAEILRVSLIEDGLTLEQLETIRSEAERTAQEFCNETPMKEKS